MNGTREQSSNFSAPVQIPGHTLVAGKYVFQLADSDSDRNVVQILSEDSIERQNLVTTLMVVPDYLGETPDKPVVHFEERPSGSPEAIHGWFYPGENKGWEYVDPTRRRRETNEMSSDSARDETTPRDSGELDPGVGRIAPSRPFPWDAGSGGGAASVRGGHGRKQPEHSVVFR
jgi:hypothetical protein